MALAFTWSCGSDTSNTGDLRLDLKTDFVSGVEFDSLRIEFGDGDASESQDRLNRDADNFLRGQRVGSAVVPPGPLPVTVTLYRSLEPVIARRVIAQVTAAVTTVTMIITRSCEGVECPNDNPALDSCLGSQCVDPRCTVETRDFCPADFCASDTECEVVSCADPLCGDGVCFSVPVDSRCDEGLRCDAILGCVPVDTIRDAGLDAPALDAGTDAPVSDSGADTTEPFDAGLETAPFSTPRLLTSLSAGAEVDDPTLSPDLLEIFFKSAGPPQQVWSARRASLGEPFDTPVELELVPGSDTTSPELRQDGLVLYFSAEVSGHFDTYRTSRADLNAPFPIGTIVAENNTSANEFAFAVNASDTHAVFSRSGLRRTTRATEADRWGMAIRISELNRTGTEIDAHLVGEGLVIYYGGEDPDDPTTDMEIWRAERPSLDEPFAMPMRIGSVSSDSEDTDPWVSADERIIVFTSNRDGRDQIYFAVRAGGMF